MNMTSARVVALLRPIFPGSWQAILEPTITGTASDLWNAPLDSHVPVKQLPGFALGARVQVSDPFKVSRGPAVQIGRIAEAQLRAHLFGRLPEEVDTLE